jgi:hypothetical protein
MLDKTYKIETKHQQFLNKEAKRRFDEVWSTKTIAKQGDTFHVTIWVDFYQALMLLHFVV